MHECANKCQRGMLHLYIEQQISQQTDQMHAPVRVAAASKTCHCCTIEAVDSVNSHSNFSSLHHATCSKYGHLLQHLAPGSLGVVAYDWLAFFPSCL